MSEPLRYQYFKHTRGGTAPEPFIGVLIVGILERVLKDVVQNIRSPSTDDAMFQILTQDDQPKPKELLWVGLDPSITYSTQKPSRALVEGPHLGKLLSLKLKLDRGGYSCSGIFALLERRRSGLPMS